MPKNSDNVRKGGINNLIPGPKPRKKTKELQIKCEELTDDCLAVLVNEMHNSRRAADRIKAVELILAYGHGKPKQQTEITGAGGDAVMLVVSKP